MKQTEMDKLSLVERVAAPTPGFFVKLRNIALALAAISGALLASPVALPAIVTTVAGYLGVAAAVAGAVSQITVES